MSDVVPGRGSRLAALPGLTRLAASAGLRTAEWSLSTGFRVGRRALSAATDPRTYVGLASGAATASVAVADFAATLSTGAPLETALKTASRRFTSQPESDSKALEVRRSLREQGEALLARSRDVWDNEAGHPAYQRILGELATDEARILLLMLREGPQPAVDVRAAKAMGLAPSELVAPGLTMIGARAGVRYLDQVPAYLGNLFRLGLIWFSREQLRDPAEYQVLEAQPDVLAAVHAVRSAKVIRRSIQLTPFGLGFCKASLVDDPEESFPEHAAPSEGDTAG